MKYISPEGLEKLKKELENRRTKIRQEIANRLEEAKGLGDLSENTEYHTAKEEQIFNENRIIELDEIIKSSIVFDSSKNQTKRDGKVDIGSVIEVEMLKKKDGDNGKRTFVIVGSQEANPAEGKISNESPLGMAFFGREIGDIIEAETPKGKVGYKIKSIK